MTGADRQQLSDLESLLCATLQSLLRKVTAEDALGIADTVMTALLMMFGSGSGQRGGVQEDAIMTVGVLVEGRSTVSVSPRNLAQGGWVGCDQCLHQSIADEP